MRQSDNHHGMTRWYNPVLLAKIGFRAAVSTAVGQVTDNRQIQAALQPDAPLFDHSGDAKAHQDLWLDYVADLGDGYASTYAVAAAISADAQLDGEEVTKRGSILIMGGDEVYPEPSLHAYSMKTIAPWNAAAKPVGAYTTTLYALPGNHDWYDGLQAFTDIFCNQGRACAGIPDSAFDHLKPCQNRSYFALKLTQGWWMAGIDIQLNNSIDSTQLSFFEDISRQMEKGDQIILCAPTPSWALEANGYEGATNLLASVGELLTRNKGELRLIVAGDVHHYSRYASDDAKLTLITAGGGGAFLHPTHALPETATISWQQEPRQKFEHKMCYPPMPISRKLAFKNLQFFFSNLEFSAAMGGLYMLLTWLLEARNSSGAASLSQMFETMLSSHISLSGSLARFFQTIPKSPEFALLVVVFAAALIAFNQTPNLKNRIVLGVVHSLAHFAGLVMVYCMGIALVMELPSSLQTGFIGFGLFLLTMFILGAIVGGTLFGLFLLFSLNVMGIQWTNAFSSLRIENYKNFLRMKIAPDGTLTVYAFGIDDINGDGRARLIERIIIPK